jgi:DNA-binding transcriptional ArsR family regulator
MDRLEDSKSPLSRASSEATSPSRRTRRRQLKIATQSEFSEKSRIFVYEMSELFCRILPSYSQHMQNDLAKLLIVNALGAANVQRLMATPQREPYESMDARIPAEMQVPANALSIADSTGLPRETVRRKLKELLAAGFVMTDERGGYRLKPGSLQTDELQAAYYASFKAMMDVFEACLDARMVELE